MQKALYSKYIIDGVPQELTPAGLLAPVLEKAPEQELQGGTVIDETMDPAPGPIVLEASLIDDYLAAIEGVERRIPVPFAAPCTRGRIAEALVDSMWRVGNFRLDDLPLTVKWTFNPGTVGDMAAFYASVESAADYIDALGIALRRCVCENDNFGVKVATPFSGAPLLVDDQLHPDPQSWLVYVPFDTCDYRLGGSLLAQALRLRGGIAPQLTDADYFIDCFELVRELAEDGILLSAATVGAGGMAAALKRMCNSDAGASVDVADVLRASGCDAPHVLFSELPGAILQVRDVDFDYIDAEFLLQDVAYFPLGHPIAGGELKISASDRPGIQTILESLMQNAEGED
ncbi:MAG: hypothetical protein IKZ51_03885 [Bacteroidales bacterium]|nr:hypothetical protein [Bacteroidales bacterium]